MRHIKQNGVGGGKYGTLEKPKSKHHVDAVSGSIDKRRERGAKKGWITAQGWNVDLTFQFYKDLACAYK